jgi:L-2,4-diaminobutyric acid acetyltransferase
MSIKIRKTREGDFLKVHEFVEKCDVLVTHPEHFYKIILRYFGDSCFLAEKQGNVIGFLMGFFSQKTPSTYFLWQIGTDASMRREGIGKKLITYAEQDLKKRGCTRIELTIDPENTISKNLFEKLGYENISNKEGKTIQVKDTTAVKDYYKPGRHFILYEKII